MKGTVPDEGPAPADEGERLNVLEYLGEVGVGDGDGKGDLGRYGEGLLETGRGILVGLTGRGTMLDVGRTRDGDGLTVVEKVCHLVAAGREEDAKDERFDGARLSAGNVSC